MTNHAAQLAIIKHVTRQESRSSAGNCQAELHDSCLSSPWQLPPVLRNSCLLIYLIIVSWAAWFVTAEFHAYCLLIAWFVSALLNESKWHSIISVRINGKEEMFSAIEWLKYHLDLVKITKDIQVFCKVWLTAKWKIIFPWNLEMYKCLLIS